MKKIIITSAIVATILALLAIALCDLEVFLNTVLIAVLVALLAAVIAMAWNGFVEIKAEVERRKRIKRQQEEEM